MAQNKNIRFYEILLFVGTAVWGSSFFITKDIVSYTNPFVYNTYRFLLAAIIMVPIVIFSKNKLLSNLKQGIVLSLALWIVITAQAVGMVYTEATNSGFITCLFIIFVPLFSAIFFKTRLGLSLLIAVIIDLTGLWFLTGGICGFNRGDFLMIIAAVVTAVHILLVNEFLKKGMNSITATFQQFLFCGIFSIIVALVFKHPLSVDMGRFLFPIAYLVLLPTVFCFIVQLTGQKHIEPMKATLIFTLEPVFAALFAWTLGNEKFLVTKAFGGFLMFLGMIVYGLPINIWVNKLFRAGK